MQATEAPGLGKEPDVLGSKIIGHLDEHGDNLSFSNFFWRECEPNDYELRRYSKYVEVLKQYSTGKRPSKISKDVCILGYSVDAWTSFRQKPKLAHFLSLLLELGEPKPGFRWLSINNTSRHGVPLGPLIQVPLRISKWKEVEFVIEQISRSTSIEVVDSRRYMFGFLLGIVIGDAAKKRQKTWHRHMELVLSKRYETSVRIGDFACRCAQSLGLRMKRMKDSTPVGKPHGFFVWESQSSALVDWIFNICLGLDDDELTTYDSVRMDWVLEAPEDFRRGLLQGIAESDGSVNISGQEVEFWIGPSWDLVKALLATFGVKAFRSREALVISRTLVKKALEIPIFAPHLNTVRCQRFVKLARASHIGHGRRLPSAVRELIMTLAMKKFSIPSISERVLEDFGIIPTYETTQRWARKALAIGGLDPIGRRKPESPHEFR